ncbi:enoyl-CoA hydratase/isomerase family protein [Marinobacteraceae bacterium S3BR75-40.1]
MTDQPVIIEERELTDGRRLGVVTLNAPRALNALSLEMIEALLPKLREWAKDPGLAAVWLDGAGDKAFCAGGDIVSLYRSMTESQGHPELAERFFTEEYQLDYLIHTFPKPFIVWGNGVVMGGGLGLMGGASHKVVTESAKIAMPEITIGLYPDVAGSWFLNRMPRRTGLFIGLTGAHMNAADALFLGLGDRFITHNHHDAVLAALTEANWRDRPAQAVVGDVLRDYEEQSGNEKPESPVWNHFDAIQALTDADDLEGMVSNITGYAGDDPWLNRAAKTLAAGSPTSMALVYRQWQRSTHQSLAEVFRQELVLSVNCARLGEFAEGVRALLIDKDKQPRWRYPDLASMDSAWVERFYESPWGEGEHPLANLDSGS